MDLLVLLKLYLALSSLCSAVTLASLFIRFCVKVRYRRHKRKRKRKKEALEDVMEDEYES